MKPNIGKVDRAVRIVVGLLLIANYFVGTGHLISWVGLILIATGLISFCPLYLPLKLDTRSVGEKAGLK